MLDARVEREREAGEGGRGNLGSESCFRLLEPAWLIACFEVSLKDQMPHRLTCAPAEEKAWFHLLFAPAQSQGLPAMSKIQQSGPCASRLGLEFRH